MCDSFTTIVKHWAQGLAILAILLGWLIFDFVSRFFRREEKIDWWDV